MSACIDFAEAIRAAGIEPPAEIIADGQLHRFATNGRGGDSAGWYVCHSDGVPAGAFGDWRAGISESWKASGQSALSDEERREQAARIRAAKRKAAEARRDQHAKAAAEARHIWDAAAPAPDNHPYLARKHIEPHDARLAGDARLIVPAGINGKLVSLQFIAADGSKRFLPGAATGGAYANLGDPNAASELLIAEGFATAATLRELTSLPVLVAFSAGNLEAVAVYARKRFPDHALTICADDDWRTEGNPGLSKATQTAKLVGARLAVPVFGEGRQEKDTDFNDLARQAGPEAVLAAMKAARIPGQQGERLPGSSPDFQTIGREVLACCKGPDWLPASTIFIKECQHGTAADLLLLAMGGSVRSEKLGPEPNSGYAFFRRADGTCYYTPFPIIRIVARAVLEKAVNEGFAVMVRESSGKDIKEVYSQAGKARAKARTRDFIAGALAFFADRVLVTPAIPWNTTREAIPTLTEVLDFSGLQLSARPARPEEYFRDPAPCAAAEILAAPRAARFEQFLEDLFADPDTRRSALECWASCIAGVPRKTFYLWHNEEGDGGKNTAYDLLARLVPERIVMAKNALILYRGESSERRFGESVLRGRSGVFFDEVGGIFDIAQVKRYTSLTGIRGEEKGKPSVEFPQTWALVALCNQLPRFFPADDGAFLSRVFVLKFSSVFYRDAEEFNRRLGRGVEPARLKQAADKDLLINELLQERPAILAQLARAWIGMRPGGGNPFESAECQRARETYRKANDLAERFFDEYLQRDQYGALEYEEVKKAWSEFTGEARPAMRDVVGGLVKRFPFIVPKKTHGVRKLRGVRFKDDPENGEDLGLYRRNHAENGGEEDSPGDAGDPNSHFVPRERKKGKKTYKAENGVLSPPRPPVPEDLSGLVLPDLEELAEAVAAYADGPPQHPECLRDYERLAAEISRRQEAPHA